MTNKEKNNHHKIQRNQIILKKQSSFANNLRCFTYGTRIVNIGSMKVLLISNEQELIREIKRISLLLENEIHTNSSSADPLDVHSAVHKIYPTLVIIDDDFLKPNSARIIRSLKDINNNFKIIFITSDESMELGKEISQLGVHYYALKPVGKDELMQALISTQKTFKITN